jgi:hypothetical protein
VGLYELQVQLKVPGLDVTIGENKGIAEAYIQREKKIQEKLQR